MLDAGSVSGLPGEWEAVEEAEEESLAVAPVFPNSAANPRTPRNRLLGAAPEVAEVLRCEIALVDVGEAAAVMI